MPLRDKRIGSEERVNGAGRGSRRAPTFVGRRRLSWIATPLVPLAGVALFACSKILDLPDPALTPALDAAPADAAPLDAREPETGDAADDASSNASDPPGSTVMAVGRPFSIALDDLYLYWGDANHFVGRVDKSGQNSVTMAAGDTSYLVPWVGADGTNVYWSSLDGLHGCPRSGCGGASENLTAALSLVGYPNSAALDGARIYFALSTSGELWWVGTSGGSAARLGTYTNFTTVHSFDGVVYASDSDGSLYRLTAAEIAQASSDFADAGTSTNNPAGSGPTGDPLIAADNMPKYALAASGSRLYYAAYALHGSVSYLDLPDTTPHAVAGEQVNPIDMTLNAGFLYWTNQGSGRNDGAIMRCAVDNCVPTPVLSGLNAACNLLVDDRYVFWTNVGPGEDTVQRRIYRIDKPK